MDDLIAVLRPKIEEVLTRDDIELVAITLHRSHSGLSLRLLVDTRQGITIDACARVNREIGDMIERESLIGESYTLEVSSPGLDRPLREKKDFQRLLGRSVKVWPMQEGRPCEPVTGVIETVGENGITLTSRERTLRFDFKDIFKAKQAMEF